MADAGRRITQETFDAAVEENMEEFDMERAEAVADAIKQFEMSGVDLRGIVTSAEGSASHPVLSAAQVVKEFATSEGVSVDAVTAALTELKALCEASRENQSIAGSNFAVAHVQSAASKLTEHPDALQASFHAASALCRRHSTFLLIVRRSRFNQHRREPSEGCFRLSGALARKDPSRCRN